MQLTINGKLTETAAGSTLQNLLDQLRLDCQQVVVERNSTIVPRQRFGEEFLAGLQKQVANGSGGA